MRIHPFFVATLVFALAILIGPALPVWALRSPILWLIPAKIPRNSLRCHAAQSNALPHWPPTSSRQFPPSPLSPVLYPVALPRSTGTHYDASLNQSVVGSARPWSDPESVRPGPSPETSAAPKNRLRARRFPSRSRSLQNSPPATIENRFPAAAMGAPFSSRKI